MPTQTDTLAARIDELIAEHRDLVSRLGFGNNITEPMAENDTIVAWFEERSSEANEWQESQLWRADCYAKGHPEDDDCRECDPYFAHDRGRAEVAAAVLAVLSEVDEWTPYDSRDTGETFLAESVRDLVADLRAALSDAT